MNPTYRTGSSFCWLALITVFGLSIGFARAPTLDPTLPPPPPPETAPAPLDPKLPTLFVIGDSTAASNDGVAVGWAVPFPAYFDPTKINVANRARSGRSSRTFLTEGWWDKVLADLKPGDFVLIQFGHNDGGAVNEEPPGSKNPPRARGSLPGLGEETREIDNVITKKHEVVHTFGWYLRKFIADTRAKGATPIVCSLVPRKTWQEGKIVRNQADYAGWAEAVAGAEGAAFVDLNEIIARHYDELGPEKVDPLFGDPHTHTSAAGAELSAQCVIAGLKSLKDDPLAAFFSTKAAAVPVYQR